MARLRCAGIGRSNQSKGTRMTDKEAMADPMREVQRLGQEIEQDHTYGYASRLAVAIWQKHYMKDAPKWKPLDTTEGVLTQIDNMTCGLVKEKPAQPEQERNFCSRCGKRTLDLITIHTCTPPKENT